MTSIFGMLGVDLTAPDHTTLSRRGQHLALALRRARPGTSLHLIVDNTGLSIVGEVSEDLGTVQRLVAERSTVTIGLSTEVLLKTGGRRTDPLPRRGY